MQMTEVNFGAAKPIEGYGADYYRVDTIVYPAPVLFAPGHAEAWQGYDDLDPLLRLAGQIDVVFIGTGPSIAPIPAKLRTRLEEAGMGVEIMASATACRTYNVLLSEGRRIAVALLPAG
ncbi:Mth938-like domain-containing protein [Pararhodobacter sp.]|uniref:Mth938-like domain-containing protein n=1 Tax=Pararhodobacter sp. TaxID=2127056 RepID=UPI002B0007DE|nr:Mth938-like domain-containing protein [Pararhodobacter sp.]